MSYNKTDYDILYFMKRENFDTEFKSCTIKAILEEGKFSQTKIRTAINDFVKDGFVSEGIKQGRAKTYYVTEKGILALKELIVGE